MHDETTAPTAAPARPGLLRTLAHRPAGDEATLPVEGHLPPFVGATGWLNSEPLTPDGLRGGVVLVDFWTYTCINWLRTFPYVRAWATKYADHGLTVIGVHTPEFGFERDVENVVARSRGFNVEYPIAIDSDYGVWTAFANHFWPAVYIADADGRIRFHHFGEGEYAMIEMVIQQLLLEAGSDGFDPGLVSVDAMGFEVPADWETLRTAETYLGLLQANAYASADAARPGEAHTYGVTQRLALNTWAVAGPWTLASHAAVSAGAGAAVVFRFQARDVNLVMGPVMRGEAIPFRVRLDGEAPGEAHGDDVDGAGAGTLLDQRLYQLIRRRRPVDGTGVVEIEFDGAGAEAYCFTFG
ncbi:MAG: thioredoxin [Chloroflexota bacterium]